MERPPDEAEVDELEEAWPELLVMELGFWVGVPVGLGSDGLGVEPAELDLVDACPEEVVEAAATASTLVTHVHTASAAVINAFASCSD